MSDEFGQVVLGRFRMTCADAQPPLDLLVSRHARRARRRMRGRSLLVVGVVVAFACITIACTKAMGPVAGATIGALLSLFGLLALNQLQQQRRVSVELNSGERLEFTRADATHLAILCDGLSWSLRVRTRTGDRLVQEVDGLAVLARVIPLFQRSATGAVLESAVRLLRASPNPTQFIRSLATNGGTSLVSGMRFLTDPQSIWARTADELVALEILATEGHERAALREEVSSMSGELQDALLIADIIERELA